jgi:hypothetical protein
MKSLLTILCAAALACAGSAAAQDESAASKQSKEVQQKTKTTTDKSTAKTSSDTVYGKVEAYEAGKSLKVTTPDAADSAKTFELEGSDVTAKAPSNIKVGDWVKVTEKTDNNNHKTITVQRSSEKSASSIKKS